MFQFYFYVCALAQPRTNLFGSCWLCIFIITIILYTYIAHQTIKLSIMRCVRILTEQECFKARLNEVMETEFCTL